MRLPVRVGQRSPDVCACQNWHAKPYPLCLSGLDCETLMSVPFRVGVRNPTVCACQGWHAKPCPVCLSGWACETLPCVRLTGLACETLLSADFGCACLDEASAAFKPGCIEVMRNRPGMPLYRKGREQGWGGRGKGSGSGREVGQEGRKEAG